jgi:hypothetical protein
MVFQHFVPELNRTDLNPIVSSIIERQDISSRMSSSVSPVPQVVPSDRVNSDATKAALISPSLLFTLSSLENDEKIQMLINLLFLAMILRLYSVYQQVKFVTLKKILFQIKLWLLSQSYDFLLLTRRFMCINFNSRSVFSTFNLEFLFKRFLHKNSKALPLFTVTTAKHKLISYFCFLSTNMMKNPVQTTRIVTVGSIS